MHCPLSKFEISACDIRISYYSTFTLYFAADIEDKECTLKNLMVIFISSANHYSLIGVGLEVDVSDMQPLPNMTHDNLRLVFERWIDSGKNVTWRTIIQVCENFPDQLGKAKNALLKFLSLEAES